MTSFFLKFWLSVIFIDVIQVAYVMSTRKPADWLMVRDFITYGIVSVVASVAFLRVVWRDYSMRRAKVEDASDQ